MKLDFLAEIVAYTWEPKFNDNINNTNSSNNYDGRTSKSATTLRSPPQAAKMIDSIIKFLCKERSPTEKVENPTVSMEKAASIERGTSSCCHKKSGGLPNQVETKVTLTGRINLI